MSMYNQSMRNTRNLGFAMKIPEFLGQVCWHLLMIRSPSAQSFLLFFFLVIKHLFYICSTPSKDDPIRLLNMCNLYAWITSPAIYSFLRTQTIWNTNYLQKDLSFWTFPPDFVRAGVLNYLGTSRFQPTVPFSEGDWILMTLTSYVSCHHHHLQPSLGRSKVVLI